MNKWINIKNTVLEGKPPDSMVYPHEARTVDENWINIWEHPICLSFSQCIVEGFWRVYDGHKLNEIPKI